MKVPNPKSNPRISSVAVIYLTFSVLYFAKSFKIPGKTAFPTFVLTFCLPFVYANTSKLIIAALFFSAIGDICGYFKKTPLQLLFFGFAHGFYIAYFIPYATPSLIRRCSFSIGIVILLVGFVVFMYPYINDIVLKVGMVLYSSIVFMMVLSICLFAGECKLGFLFASALFVFSDVSIAVNRFVKAIPYQKYLIMMTYYSAQFMFWFFSIQRNMMIDELNDARMSQVGDIGI